MNPELPPSPKPPAPPAPLSGDATPVAPAQKLAHHGALLHAIRNQQRLELWLQGACAGVALFTVLLLAAGLLGVSYPLVGKLLIYAAPVALLASLTFFGVFLARRMVGDDRRTARLLAERRPDVGADVLSAVELRSEFTAAGVSQQLIDAFVANTDAKASTVSPKDVVDRRSTQRLGLVVAGVFVVCLALAAVFEDRWTRGLSSSLKEREEDAVAVIAEPITGDVELSYSYPPHTGFAPRTVPGTNGEISAPAGTRVSMKTRADRKVSRAELVMDGATVPLNVTEERDLSGELVVSKAGSYKFRFSTARGRQLAEGPPIPINVEADAPPKVKILTPGEEVEVDPGQKVTMKYDVTDDFGVTELALVYRVTGKKEEVRIKLPADEGRSTRASYTWDLAPLKLRAGDRVSYYVEAKDNDAVAGPKKGVSRTLTLKTYSAAEHRREALQKAEALWERMITQLADRMEGPDRDRGHTLEQVKSQLPVDERGTLLVKDIRSTVEELAKSKDAPPELWNAMSNIADSLQTKVQQTVSTRRLAIRYAATRPSDVDLNRRLIRVVEAEIAELEKDVLYLEALLDRHKIQDLKEMTKELAADRRELAQLVEDYKKTNDPAQREQILEEVAQMKQRINELMARMAELAKGIRDEHFNAEAMAELMQEDNMAKSMDEIDKLLREGKIDEAMKKLSEMSMQMEEMIKEMEEADGELGDQLDPELAQQFDKFMEDLGKTAEDQKKLADETKQLRDKYRQKTKERIAQKGKQLREELLKDVEKLSRDYQQMDPNDLGSYGGKNLEATQSELENMRNALQIEDYDLAAEAGSRAEQASQSVSRDADQMALRDELFQNPGDKSRQTADKAKQDERKLREVNEKLAQLFPDPNQMMSDQDKQKMKQQAQQQQQLQKQAEQLRNQMEELGDKAPIFDSEAEAQMQRAGERMQDATQRLESKDAARGHGEQRAALDQLQKFQQQMQQQGKGKGGRKGGMPLPMMSGGGRGSGGRTRNEKIEIPDEDQFLAPREFRKDLLDAMKQGAPDRYKDQVKRYYEELVK